MSGGARSRFLLEAWRPLRAAEAVPKRAGGRGGELDRAIGEAAHDALGGLKGERCGGCALSSGLRFPIPRSDC